jgi:hypothetical protein
MNTKTMDNRWVEVPKLTLWAINRLNKLCEYFAENQLPNGQLKAPEDTPNSEKKKEENDMKK